MKLRIQGDSVRLRLGRSEVERLREAGHVADKVQYSATMALMYAVESVHVQETVTVDAYAQSLTIKVPSEMVRVWTKGNDVGIYATCRNGGDGLKVAIEKDFACLDGSEAENRDAYPNPNLHC